MAITPVSQGKLKSLWDAIRTTPDDTAPGAAPVSLPPVTPPAQANLAGAVAAAPSPGDSSRVTPPPPPPPPSAGPIAPPPPEPTDPIFPTPAPMPPGPVPGSDSPVLPSVSMAAPDINKMPASGSVSDLEGRVNAKPSLLHQIGQVGINLGLAGAAAASHMPGGEAGVLAGEQAGIQQGNVEHQSLVSQLAAARAEREKEFDTAQRTTELANAAAETNRTRDIISRTLAGSREAVADTNAGSRTGVATINAGARRSAAETAADARIRAAVTAANASVTRGKYAADAAANRQTRSLNAAAGRQQAGFTHTDTKPTADEDRRTDMAAALDNLVTEYKGIYARRPDLWGKLNGRLTEGKMLAGTDDADIQNLRAIKEAGGTIAMAAHAMRNANHIAKAGDTFFNLHDEGTGSADAALKSAHSFDTIQRPTLSGRVAGTSPKPKTGSQPTKTPAAPAVEQWGKDKNGKPVRLN